MGGMGFRMGQAPPPQQGPEGVQDEAMVQTIGMLDQLGERDGKKKKKKKGPAWAL